MGPAVIAALIAAGGLGGFLGGQGRQPIDPALLARLFGPNALAGDTQTLFQTLAGSPAFAAMLNSASASGTLAGNNTRAAFARSGLSSSGVGALGGAVSRGFGQNLILGARGNLWLQALQAAQQSLSQRAGIWGQSQLNYQNTPTMAQSFGAALTGGASTALTAGLNKPGATKVTPDGAGTFNAGTSVVTGPMKRIGTYVPGQFRSP